MDQIRIAEVPQSEIRQVDLLVSEAFHYPFPQNYFDDFPVWGSPNVVRIGGYSGTELLSHVGIQFRTLRSTEAREKVALIGAVATKASHRGRGYSSILMKAALERIDLAGCNWTFLWGSEHDFYSKFGFRLAGKQARGLISELVENGSRRTQVPSLGSEIRSGFSNTIFESFLSRSSGIQFEGGDLDWLVLQKTVKWFYIERPFSFIAYERGLDLPKTVHEFGGDIDGIRKLLFHVYQNDPDAQIIAPPKELLNLGFREDSCVIESLCLSRPRSPDVSWKDEYWISGLSAV